MKKSFLLYVALAVLLAVGTADAQQNAKEFLKKKHASVIKILKKENRTPSKAEARNLQLFKTLDELLDYNALSREALRDHWAGLSSTQQTEFVDLLKQLVERNYRKNLESTLDYDIRYLNQTAQSDETIVHTVARSKKNRRAPEIRIDYTLKKNQGAWRVVDVITDGVSLIRNYRNQFNRIINRDGWDELLKRMRKRIKSGTE
jgi:phospholipid transport system substrate-binding protein